MNLPLIRDLDKQVVILSLGRLASALGTGLTIFYAPIFFVNVQGMSATSVGAGIGIGGIFGIAGRFLGGTCADHPKVGRKGSLLIAAALLALGAVFFACTEVFWQFVIGNILTGLGVGYYWPAAESFISDITKSEKLNEAFAFIRLGDYFGLGLGVIAGGMIIGYHGAYRVLFILDALSYMALFLFILFGLKETLIEDNGVQISKRTIFGDWIEALKDRCLLLYAFLNLLFTNNILQMSSTLPLYFSNFIDLGQNSWIASNKVSIFFSIYILVVSAIVLPLARLTALRRKTRVLILACLLWTIAHLLIASLGAGWGTPFILAVLTLISFSIGNALYAPSASSLVVEISPVESKAKYLSINSLCWGISGAIGPAIGLAALDHGSGIACGYWIVLSAVSALAVSGLMLLEHMISKKRDKVNEQVV